MLFNKGYIPWDTYLLKQALRRLSNQFDEKPLELLFSDARAESGPCASIPETLSNGHLCMLIRPRLHDLQCRDPGFDALPFRCKPLIFKGRLLAITIAADAW